MSDIMTPGSHWGQVSHVFGYFWNEATLFNTHHLVLMRNILWWGSGSIWLRGGWAHNGKQMTAAWEEPWGPQCVKRFSRWPAGYRPTVPGTRSHTLILLSPWALVATQWYSPASWVCTPLTCRDESGRSFTLPARARMVRPMWCQVKLWRMDPSTWQDSTATPPTTAVTLTAGFRTGGGSVWNATKTSNWCYQPWYKQYG